LVCALHRPWDTSDFALGLKCFSDTSVDILFTFVNALKMPPPQFGSVGQLSVGGGAHEGQPGVNSSFC